MAGGKTAQDFDGVDMDIYCRGEAVIAHASTDEEYEIDSDELDWEVVSSQERGMGQESVYEARVQHPQLGELSWSIVEYPVGAEGNKNTNVSPHELIEDFEYGLEHRPERDGPLIVFGTRVFGAEDAFFPDLSEESFRSRSSRDQAEYLVQWFRNYFEDPAEQTPHDSREGGYQYIWGGPYEARDELSGAFDGIAAEKAIELAVEELEQDGYDWAPSSAHPDLQEAAREFEAERERPTADELHRRAVERPQVGIDPFAREQADELRAEIAKLRAALGERPPRHGNIGHNQPPDDMSLDDETVDEIDDAANTLDEELSKDILDTEKAVEQVSRIEKVIRYFAEKCDRTLNNFCDQFGKRMGDVIPIGAAVTVVGGGGFWGGIWGTIVSVYEKAVSLLGFLI